MKRLNIKLVKESFIKEGYRLITDDYFNCYQKLKYICPNKHIHETTWSNWNLGRRCPYCAKRPIFTIEIVKKVFFTEGYKLISEKYNNARQKLKYICPKGHKSIITLAMWNQGQRCALCYHERLSMKWGGKNHPMWKGGISCEPYCQNWTKEFKEYIKERDGHRCLNPDCWGNITRLSVHHIDYNKKNCEPRNLITLCSSCNSRANFNRKWHESWYRAIILKRYYGVV